MNTVQKKKKKKKMAPVSRRGAELSLDDCRCPVCLEIFMEPVTLPCTHTFCKDCFLESVDKATLCCPMCRKRISTWARLNSRNNTLVDQKLWTQIQTCFPLQCQRRLDGQDAVASDDPGVSEFFPRVSQPGELKQEYEEQVTKLTEEKRVLDEEERRASEEYIQRLLAEEEELLQEERRRHEEDERLAKLLSNQLNAQENVVSPDVTPAKKKKKKKDVRAGQMERFLCPLPSCSFMDNKENILLSQVEVQVDRPLPKLDYYGRQTDRSEPPSPSDGGPSSAKRKISELETPEDEEVWEYEDLTEVSALQGIGECEVELLSRRQQQEDEDRRLALLLQKELDQEEKQKATDRRKGSSDPYPLRQNSRGSDKPSRPSTSTPSCTKTSSSSTNTSTASCRKASSRKASSSSGASGSKQATLTEMFSGLSS